MSNTIQQIVDIAEPLVAACGAFLVDVSIQQGRKRSVVQVFVDTDTGITVDQCAQISRLLGKELEVQDVVAGSYELLVSSPGLDRPLKHLRQIRKNVGRKFLVRIKTAASPQTLEAVLTGVEGERLEFRSPNGEEHVVLFPDILEMKEVLPW